MSALFSVQKLFLIGLAVKLIVVIISVPWFSWRAWRLNV